MGEEPTVEPTVEPNETLGMDCTDLPTPWMLKNSKDCASWKWGVQRCKRCNSEHIHSVEWRRNKFCQYSCYMAGCGYDGDVCTSLRPQRLITTNISQAAVVGDTQVYVASADGFKVDDYVLI